MCYGMGCRFENFWGECRKPYREPCPMEEEDDDDEEWEREEEELENLERELFDKQEGD